MDLRGRERRAGRLAAGLAVGALAVLVLLVLRGRSTVTAESAPNPEATAEAPPDLSAMTPRERFDRLYRRVLGASEGRDSVTVARFAPMAMAAYAQLDSVDADARYHAAVLHLHIMADTAGALRLADSLLAVNPGHLFGFLIRGTAARLSGDEQLLQKAEIDYLAAWDREMKAPRAEYRDHQAMLEQFHAAARAGRATPGGAQ